MPFLSRGTKINNSLRREGDEDSVAKTQQRRWTLVLTTVVRKSKVDRERESKRDRERLEKLAEKTQSQSCRMEDYFENFSFHVHVKLHHTSFSVIEAFRFHVPKKFQYIEGSDDPPIFLQFYPSMGDLLIRFESVFIEFWPRRDNLNFFIHFFDNSYKMVCELA